MDDADIIRARVRLIAARRGWTIADVARRLTPPVRRQRLAAILSRSRPPSPGVRRRLAVALEVCTAELDRPLTDAEWADLGRLTVRLRPGMDIA